MFRLDIWSSVTLIPFGLPPGRRRPAMLRSDGRILADTTALSRRSAALRGLREAVRAGRTDRTCRNNQAAGRRDIPFESGESPSLTGARNDCLQLGATFAKADTHISAFTHSARSSLIRRSTTCRLQRAYRGSRSRQIEVGLLAKQE